MHLDACNRGLHVKTGFATVYVLQLEQVGTREHADRLSVARDYHCVRPALQGSEDFVHRRRRVDRCERGLHRGGDVLVQHVRIDEHALEQCAVL